MTALASTPTADARPETLAMLAEHAERDAALQRQQRRQERESAECAEAERQINAAAPYLDAAPRAPGKLRPSQILALRYCMLHAFDHHDDARQLLTNTLAEARRRYRKGYFATPFGDPVRRPATEQAA
jgi:hypothetical protein